LRTWQVWRSLCLAGWALLTGDELIAT